MNSLKIPNNGLMLKASAGRDVGPLPPQAFAISLNDNVIEGMIKCVQNGEDISLALGAKPTFLYGTKTHRISQPSDPTPLDLFITKPFESTQEAYQLPLTMGIFNKPNKFLAKAKAEAKVRSERIVSSSKEPTEKASAPQPGNASSSSNLDSDIEALQNDLKRRDAAKGRSVIVAGLPPSRKSAKSAKPTFFSTNGNRSMSTSPALKPVGSPSPNPLSAAEQAVERAKQGRRALIHELAVQDRSSEHLQAKYEGSPETFKSALSKVAHVDAETKEWKMVPTYWKELDPYMYDYESEQDRQKAIENAIRQFDKQRLSPSEPQWQKLLPKEQRGKGICLSRLQGKLAGSTPMIRVQKAEDSSSSKDDADTNSDKVKSGGEAMSRSNSNPLPKQKKLTGHQAQAKRLLSNSKTKVAAPKVSPTKVKPAVPNVTKPNGGSRVLSKEIISDSDSSGEDAAPTQPKTKLAETKNRPKMAVTAKSTAKPAEKPVERSITAKPKAAVANRDSTQKMAAKRQRDDDDSSSSSGTPLSKRLKTKTPLPSQQQQQQQLKSRPADVRQAPREAVKPKTTSPAKSSPLASSPPTNASDFSSDDRPMQSRPPVSKKRKADDAVAGPAAKRQVVSAEVVSQAHKFKRYYSQYEALHHEISSLDNPPRDKLADLNDMRERLQMMKEEIYRKHESYRG
jgi:RNA polymerase II elongation factor ELL